MPTPRFLALGDSYTIGQSVPLDQPWPVQLVAQLRSIGTPIEDPVIIATTGWTTDELSAGIDAAKPQGTYDLVSLLIGVNNQFRGRDTGEYRVQFRALLARSIGFANHVASHVIVLSIPDWGATPFAIGRDTAAIAVAIDNFNAINKAEAVSAGAHYVDITQISRKAPADSTLIAPDRLHPSGKMYSEWVALVLPVAKDILKK